MNTPIRFPKRIQRKRTKGFHQPKRTRYCGRGTIYGNPFGTEPHNHPRNGRAGYCCPGCMDQDRAVNLYGQELDVIIANLEMTEEEFLSPLLKYKFLSCFCHVKEKCHVDVLIERLERFYTPKPAIQIEMF